MSGTRPGTEGVGDSSPGWDRLPPEGGAAPEMNRHGAAQLTLVQLLRKLRQEDARNPGVQVRLGHAGAAVSLRQWPGGAP